MRFYLEEIFGDEVFNLFIATHNQAEHRRLYTTNREDALVPCVAPENSVGSRHIDTVQPVRPRPRQCRHAQWDEIAVCT